MAATVYSAPKIISLPKYDTENVKNWQWEEDVYCEELKAVLLSRKQGKNTENVGEILKFPVADGYAMYMVASMRPLELVHLQLGDCWHFDYAHLLTAKEVRIKIDAQKNLEKLFGKKS